MEDNDKEDNEEQEDNQGKEDKDGGGISADRVDTRDTVEGNERERLSSVMDVYSSSLFPHLVS